MRKSPRPIAGFFAELTYTPIGYIVLDEDEPMNEQSRSRLRKRLSRIGGQVNGLQKMVDEDRYCVDILTQLAAVRSALDAVGVELLTDHVEHCVAGHAEGNGHGHGKAKVRSKDELIHEIRQTLDRFLR